MNTSSKPSMLLKAIVASSVLALLSSGAAAGTITFFDLSDSVTVTLSSDLLARGSTSTCVGEICAVRLLPPPPSSGSASWGSNTIYEQGSSQISDTISIIPTFLPNFEIEYFTVTFTSDMEGGPPLLDLGNPMTEDGTLQRAINSDIGWQLGPTGAAITDMIFFQSDVVENPANEPASLALFGLGLVGIGFSRRRQ
ncbi:MAG: PEP-CTERM sorting domain-containing protein [Candidatus Accumulibacter sp.]|uniref:PEP-CTERM sorting domain-containing protein n=1 Tax=Accumulibacter sp. TaxID=2053492 RepID=UPI001D6ECAF4|nr:PEP-CTERM sorting domain-containing protein [Accumulibacter sp.]MCB1943455.1 PEP-CTERM sorting domain-containing protein [Accumulibacter sp.]MCP5247945.1 PEP-CTERM sorting domain-containing protein [Accumulibacter sp.]